MSLTARHAYMLLLLGCIVVYGQVLWFDFVEWDDPAYVTGNPSVLAGLSWEGVQWALTTDFYGLRHPLAWISHMADVSLWGLWAGGHHLTSVLIHALAAILFFAFLHEAGISVPRALIAAALFSLHPLRIESVAWVAERKDVLCVVLIMGCLWAHGRWARTGKYWFAVLAHGIYVLALLAKPLAVVVPVLLLLVDYWPLGRTIALKRLLLEKIGYIALAGLMVATLFDPAWLEASGSGRDRFDLMTRLSLAAHSAWMLTAKFVWPLDLSFFYPVPWDTVGPKGLRGAVFLAVLIALAATQFRKRPWISVGIAWFLVALLPSSGIIQISQYAYADRYAYLPSAGQAIIVAMALPSLATQGWQRHLALALGATITCTLLALSAWQASHWRNSETLFQRAIAIQPTNHFAQLKLSDFYVHRGELELAERHGKLARNPAAGIGYQLQLARHLGQIAFKKGELDAAHRHWIEGLRLNPNDPFIHFHLGQWALATNAPVAAVEHFSIAIRTFHASSSVWEFLGVALERNGQTADAVHAYRRATQAHGGSEEARRALARLADEGVQ